MVRVVKSKSLPVALFNLAPLTLLHVIRKRAIITNADQLRFDNTSCMIATIEPRRPMKYQ
jgi:hypothetical protein